MNQEKRKNIALMRYSAIVPLISGSSDSYPSLSAFFRDVSAKGIKAPDGTIKHYAVSTLELWYVNYKKGGFDALLPAGRSDNGRPRKLDDALQEEIRHMKTNYPRMSAASIYRQLQDNGSITRRQLSESTVSRYINVLSLQTGATGSTDMRRYERPHINEVWCGDSCAGSYLKMPDGKKRRFYVIALIDDASRFVLGTGVFFNDNFINLMSVMKSAISKYGKPKMFNFDNGSPYKNKQMELLAARIGSAVNYCKPYTPQAKAKIERWFRTMKDQWLASLDTRSFHSIDEVRTSLSSYVSRYNMNIHGSLNGKTPQDRFFAEPECIRRLPQDKIDESFLLEVERRVSADSVVVIDQREYEVDFRFAGRRIRLRYSPDMKDVFVVEAEDALTPIRLLNKQENSMVKREKTYLCGGDK